MLVAKREAEYRPIVVLVAKREAEYRPIVVLVAKREAEYRPIVVLVAKPEASESVYGLGAAWNESFRQTKGLHNASCLSLQPAYHHVLRILYYVGYTISTVALVVALFIFLYYK